MEYASGVWNPFYIKRLEKVQRWAACWVLNDYSYASSVTLMQKQLSWPTLMLCCKISRLIKHSILSYASTTIAYHSMMASYYQPPTILSIPDNITQLSLAHQQLHIYQYNYYFARTIKDWNSLPTTNWHQRNQSLYQYLSNLQSYLTFTLSPPAVLSAQ